MKLLTVEDTLKLLKLKEKDSLKNGYLGDAANYAFNRFVLIYLRKMAGIKKKPTAWNKHVAKYLKEGKTVKDAARDWKKK